MMTRCLFTLLFLCCTLTLRAQSYIPADKGSSIKFRIKNFGLMVEGTITGLQGKIQFDQDNISAAQFDVSIDAGTIDTGISMRDKHLKKKEYLDTNTFPLIHFVSSKISAGKNSAWVISGHLTVKNVTKEISFPFTYSFVDGAPLFKGEFKIDRRDYGVGGSSVSMGDDLALTLMVMTTMK